MGALDVVNARYGKDTPRLKSGLLPSSRVTAQEARRWEMGQEGRSPRYTTRWGRFCRSVQ